MNYDTFLRFIFPDEMFDYFKMIKFDEYSDKVEIHFEEKNNIPKEYKESKGFMKV